MSRLAIFFIWTVWMLPAASACRWGEARTPEPLPPWMLWAWERPEDLRFIDPARTGVAYLAGTVRLSGDAVDSVPRLQPLVVPETARALPVIRLETDWRNGATLTDRQRRRVAAAIVRMAKPDRAGALQIDFDARLSERDFYRRLIVDLRRRLPEGFLSITALASWCLGDPWIADLPVDEAVPMLFRMGTGEGEVRRLLAHEGDFRLPVCRRSAGVSTDESPPAVPPGRRMYVFHPSSWSPIAYHRLLPPTEESP